MTIIRQIADDMLLGVCDIEDDAELNHREREQKAVLCLLRSMLDDDTATIYHNADGKPFIPDYNISISHTRGYAAVMLSKTHSVGIDIEYISDRVGRIATRFLHPDEIQHFNVSDTVNEETKERGNEDISGKNTLRTSSHWGGAGIGILLKAWCAKEAVYKFYSEDHLTYFDMRCRVIDADCFEVDNLKRNETACVTFHVTDDFVLAWVQSTYSNM